MKLDRPVRQGRRDARCGIRRTPGFGERPQPSRALASQGALGLAVETGGNGRAEVLGQRSPDLFESERVFRDRSLRGRMMGAPRRLRALRGQTVTVGRVQSI